MKQYCRYCCYLVTGNGIYCEKRENTLSESAAKAANKCRDFSYNPQDAFMENEKDISQDRPKRSSVTDRLRWRYKNDRAGSNERTGKVYR